MKKLKYYYGIVVGFVPLMLVMGALFVCFTFAAALGKKIDAAQLESCRQYHEKAIEMIGSKFGSPNPATYSIAYSLLYQNCLDLERRNP